MDKQSNRIAIIGAGPAGFMMFKRLTESGLKSLSIAIFERENVLGQGMPYSKRGALNEHVTNVSADEIPELSQELDDWVVNLPERILEEFEIDRETFHDKRVVPRLLLGLYLENQFGKQIERSQTSGIEVRLHRGCEVIDVIDQSKTDSVKVILGSGETFEFDRIIICTGHKWKKFHEGSIEGYYDSPYPPSKLEGRFNHKVVVRGSSLTAIDAIKTLAMNNGKFFWDKNRYKYERSENSPLFKIEMHSRDGLLPSLRVHMDEPHVDSSSLIDENLLKQNMQQNDGFLQLDFLFEEGFKKPLKNSDLDFYSQIVHLSIEQFVEEMLSHRKDQEAFDLLKAEYKESLRSIRKQESIPWKEMLGSLSFAMNYPAKHLSAEDMLRLRKMLLPLISIVIAFVPQSSCEMLLALEEAGTLTLIADGEGGKVEVNAAKEIIYETKDPDTKQVCKTFIDCTGQKHLNIEDFPFKSLIKSGTVCGARIKFRSAIEAYELIKAGEEAVEMQDNTYFLKVSGIAINDCFAVVDEIGQASKRIFLMAVPFIGGFNPDYSGLDFCEQASKRIANAFEQPLCPS